MPVMSFCWSALEKEDGIKELNRILSEDLPEDNYLVLKYIVNFLNEVSRAQFTMVFFLQFIW